MFGPTWAASKPGPNAKLEVQGPFCGSRQGIRRARRRALASGCRCDDHGMEEVGDEQTLASRGLGTTLGHGEVWIEVPVRCYMECNSSGRGKGRGGDPGVDRRECKCKSQGLSKGHYFIFFKNKLKK